MTVKRLYFAEAKLRFLSKRFKKFDGKTMLILKEEFYLMTKKYSLEFVFFGTVPVWLSVGCAQRNLFFPEQITKLKMVNWTNGEVGDMTCPVAGLHGNQSSGGIEICIVPRTQTNTHSHTYAHKRGGHKRRIKAVSGVNPKYVRGE